MATPIEIPCIKLPEVPDIPEINLFGGAKLTALLDISKGLPNQCQVTMNLLGQLAPTLAALAPILQILAVIDAIKKFASNPLVNGPDLIAEIGKIAGLLTALTPVGLAGTIVGMLQLIISFIECVISLLKSSISLQADIALAKADLDLSIEPPSLVLQASLDCAEINASIALEQTTAMMGPIAPIVDAIGTVAALVGIEIALPSADLSAAADVEAAITQLEEVVASLGEAMDVAASFTN